MKLGKNVALVSSPAQGRAWTLHVAACAALLGACAAKPVAAPQAEESSGREREPAEEHDSLSVQGLRGTLSQEEVQGSLEPRMPKFARCVQKRSDQVEWLSGHVSLEFHVKLDGSVASVYPRETSMGDRATERCIEEVARGTRFPAPHGGEADFAWSLDVPLDSSIREPVALGTSDVSEVLTASTPLVQNACGGGSYAVTAYVDPEGKVVAAGASAADEASAAKLDCVAETVQSFVFASPGSYAAKVTFSIP
jgi:hypothetical protein